MANSPSTDNYSLGKGIVYFNQKISNVFQGERDLGNAPEFSFSVALEKLEHFSSRGGIKAKDKTIISQLTPSVSFILDEINKANVALMTMATLNEVTQTAGAAAAEVVTGNLGMRLDLSYRSIGALAIPVSVITAAFVAGETVTGGTSSATGTVVSSTATTIIVVAQTGTFSAENITGSITGDATATGDSAFVSGVVLVQDSTDTTSYVAGTDYEIDTTLKDHSIGRIKILEGGSITEGDELHISYSYDAATYTEIQGFNQSLLEGQLRFVSDNPVGNDQELTVWNVSLTPDGNTALIGEDWSTLSFVGEILKDSTNHPASPYFDIVMM